MSFFDEKMCDTFSDQIISTNDLYINGDHVKVLNIRIHSIPVFNGNDTIIKTLSPVTIHSTFQKPDGKKITHFYSPYDSDFYELLKQNLHKKYVALYQEEPTDFSINRMDDVNEVIRKYKNTVIKGWRGIFAVHGSPKLKKLAFDFGIGDKNSQGFGMIDVC